MKNSKKKIIIILSIIVVILIALIGTAAAMIVTGKVALTTEQKLAKGLSDITSKISFSNLEEKLKETEKIYETPFEAETTITSKINTIELEDMNGMEELVDELKNTVNNSVITNTVKADLKNNIINDNLMLKANDIVEEISGEIEYNGDTISLRSKELNEKYIAIKRSDAESSDEYEDFVKIFDFLDKACMKQETSLYLTEEEKNHFSENYGKIFANYITEDMITEEDSTILLDEVNTTNCSKVGITLNKDQIIELFAQYLNTLENDATAKQIIIDRMNLLGDFDEDDLLDLIDDLRYDILDLDETASLKFSVYCTMFKTYGFDLEVIEDLDTAKVSTIFGKEKDEMYFTENDEEILSLIKTGDDILISSQNEETSFIIEINKIDNDNVISLNINDLEEEVALGVTITTKQISKTQNENVSNINIGFVVDSSDVKADLELILDSSIRYVDSINTTTISDSNSLDLINATQSELQEYGEKVTNNGNEIVQKMLQNSKLVNMIYSIISSDQGSYSGSYGNVDDSVTSSEFNNMFAEYAGTLTGEQAKSLLDMLSTNNANSSHTVAVSITDSGNTLLSSTENYVGISLADSLISSTNYYTILVNEIDEGGYIKAIEIVKQ